MRRDSICDLQSSVHAIRAFCKPVRKGGTRAQSPPAVGTGTHRIKDKNRSEEGVTDSRSDEPDDDRGMNRERER